MNRRDLPAPSPETLAAALLAPIRARLEGRTYPFVLGLSGLQGSGKSTLAARLVKCGQGFGTVALSLDDFYLSRTERNALARRVHPLFATRGVPGTHDLARLHATLDALVVASPAQPAWLPRFDKGRDEPVPSDQWQMVTTAPALIVLEGWCLGLPAQSEAALGEPVNALERDEDADGRWRRHVNAQLQGPYAGLWRRLDHLVLLAAPSFDVVERWRGEQEQALRRAVAPQAMDAASLRRFIAHFERLSRHALAVLPALADAVVMLDADRGVLEVRAQARTRACG